VHHNTPTLIIDPVMLFREGLRRILYEANFQPVWCSDRPPVGPLPALPEQVSALLIIGTEIEEAIVQIAEVKRLYPFCRVVLLLEPPARHQLAAALRCGVHDVPAHAPHSFPPESAYAGAVPSMLLPQRAVGLSAREISVLHRLRDGLSNKEIARGLGITEATVKVHVKAILRKAQVRNRTQVAMWAAKLGLDHAPLVAP
jgi:two-component system nitrate/nitrite response regulator NarL